MVDLREREDTPAATATPTQARLARERAERWKRFRAIREPAPPAPPSPPVLPEPAPAPAEMVAEPKPVLPDWIAQWLDHWNSKMPSTVSWRYIQQITANHFDLTRSQMLGRSRVQRCVRARQVGMLLCLELVGGSSLPQVGRWFGNRDHTTVIHARDTIRALIAADPDFAAFVDKIRREVIEESEPVL